MKEQGGKAEMQPGTDPVDTGVVACPNHYNHFSARGTPIYMIYFFEMREIIRQSHTYIYFSGYSG